MQVVQVFLKISDATINPTWRQDPIDYMDLTSHISVIHCFTHPKTLYWITLWKALTYRCPYKSYHTWATEHTHEQTAPWNMLVHLTFCLILFERIKHWTCLIRVACSCLMASQSSHPTSDTNVTVRESSHAGSGTPVSQDTDICANQSAKGPNGQRVIRGPYIKKFTIIPHLECPLH